MRSGCEVRCQTRLSNVACHEMHSFDMYLALLMGSIVQHLSVHVQQPHVPYIFMPCADIGFSLSLNIERLLWPWLLLFPHIFLLTLSLLLCFFLLFLCCLLSVAPCSSNNALNESLTSATLSRRIVTSLSIATETT